MMKMGATIRLLAGAAVAGLATFARADDPSVARLWNEALLEAIRNDFARPTVHARNLFHFSVAAWDAWAVYDPQADGWLVTEKHAAKDVEAARNQAIAHACHRLLEHRFQNSPSAVETLASFEGLMITLGYDPDDDTMVGDDPVAVGNRIGAALIAFGLTDGSNEAGGYANQVYAPVNPPLVPALPGNPDIIDPNRWQPLALDFYIDQGGHVVIGGYPEFLSPEWGEVVPFALNDGSLTVHERDGDFWRVFQDPGSPPLLGSRNEALYRRGFEMVATWSAHLDPADGVMIDASPASIGNATLPTTPAEVEAFYDFVDGGDWGTGYALNPVTGTPYTPQMVPRGDYGRVLAEFWADGPHSETPPGHWFVLLNDVSDHPAFVKQWAGEGPILDALEWDVKSYLVMGGLMHDVAVAVWGVKGYYDYPRPISALRYMADQGQCSDPGGPSYDENGIDLVPGLIEVVTAATIMPGERHEHLAGKGGANVGKIAVLAWRGPTFIVDPETDTAGVDWILAENWWPYQRPTFVTPPFAGYVSGHSTFSRAAAEAMTRMTGSPWFPGGLGEYHCPQNDYLVFEEGPSVDVTLQWASYRDASDQCSLSRIWGGIHPPADDIPGRMMGRVIGPDAYRHALRYFAGLVSCPGDLDNNGSVGLSDLISVLANWGPCPDEDFCPADQDADGDVGFTDLLAVLAAWGACG